MATQRKEGSPEYRGSQEPEEVETFIASEISPEDEQRKQFVPNPEDEQAAEERYKHFVETRLRDKMADYAVGSKVTRMDRYGEPEEWTVVTANERNVLIEHSGRTAHLSREEMVLEERAAEIGPEISAHWNEVVTTLSLLADDRESDRMLSLAEKYRADIVEMAAMASAVSEKFDPARALHNALEAIVQEHEQQARDWESTKLKHVYDLNTFAEHLRFGRIAPGWIKEGPETIAGEKTARIGQSEQRRRETLSNDRHTEETGAMSGTRVRAPLPALAEFRAEVAKTTIETAPALTNIARGVIDVATVFEVAAHDGKLMEDGELDAEIQRLDDVLKMRFAQRDVDWPAIADVKKRSYVLQEERELRRRPMQGNAEERREDDDHANTQELLRKAAIGEQPTDPKLAEVHSLLDNIRAKLPSPERKRNGVDLARDLPRIKQLRARRDACEQYDDDWEKADVALWRLEKRVLKALGELEALKPENFSTYFALLETALQHGEITKEEAAKYVNEKLSAQYFPLREVEGLTALAEKYELNVTQERAPADSTEATPVEVEQEAEPSRELVAERQGDFNEQEEAFFERGGIYRHNEPYRRVAEAFGGPDHLAELIAELEKNEVFRLDLQQLKELETASNATINNLIERIGKAVARMEKKKGRSTLQDITEEQEAERIDNFAKIASAFDGEAAFTKLYDELNHEQLAPYRWEELESIPTNEAIDAIGEAVGKLREVRESLPKNRTYETIAATLSGDRETFERHYQELINAGLAPYTLEELQSLEERTKQAGRLTRLRETIGRFIPGQSAVDQHVQAIAQAFQKLEKQGKRQSETFSHRRGGRQGLN